jgi:uncharacterized repeat protein (TIGR02543 family)
MGLGILEAGSFIYFKLHFKETIMGAALKQRGSGPLSAALVLIALGVFSVLATLVFTGCPQEEETDYPTKEGVLTVTGAENGVFYSAEVYDYPDVVTDAAALNAVISKLTPTGKWLSRAANGTLEIGLQKTDGAVWTSDGDFLVVLKKAKDASAPLKYKSAVPFTVGSATLEYEYMETAPSSCTVTFHTNGGTPSEITLQVQSGGKATPPSPAPTLVGYAIEGWYTSTDYAAKWDFDTDIVTTDINLYAKWSQVYYTVTFYRNDGSGDVHGKKTAAYKGKTEPLDEPERMGYAFDGWYTSADCAAKWDFGTDIVTTDIDLYAKWTQVFYTVTFNTGDVEHTPAPLKNIQYGIAIGEPEITKEGYTLDGWYTSTDYAAKWNFSTDNVTTDINLYAKWLQITCTVTFYRNDGSGDVHDTKTTAYNGKTVPPAEPKLTGYTFDGWYTSTDYAAKWNFGTDNVTRNINLYAKWTQIYYKVTFNTSGSAVAEQSVTYGIKATRPVTNPTRTGFTFVNWYTTSGGTTLFNFDTGITADTVIYAGWSQIYYKVTFNTGEGGSPVAEQSVTYGIKATRPAADPTRTGFTFVNWYTTSGGTTYFNFHTGITADTVIYAGWTTSTYKVVFYMNEGSGAIYDVLTVAHNGKAVAPSVSSTGCTIAGWYEDAALTSPYNFNRAVTADLELYAKWAQPVSFANAIADMAANKSAASKTYTLLGLNNYEEPYTGALTLTAANSPASVTINGGGNGRVITGNGNSITVGSGITLTLKNITFKKVPFYVAAGGKLVLDNLAIVRQCPYMGVTLSGGTLEMRNGSSVMYNGDSGVRMEGADSRFTMTGGTISNNTAQYSTVGGGVLMIGGVFTMSGGTISDNVAGNGAGVTVWEGSSATFNMSGGTIKGNRAAADGGGVYALGSTTFNMTGGRITGNNAGTGFRGGGLYITGNLAGNPQIGGTDPGTGRGWIYGNSPTDKN